MRGGAAGCSEMDRKSVEMGLIWDRPSGVALGEERNWRWGERGQSQANEGEEISDRAGHGDLDCQGKNLGDGESLTVGNGRRAFC